MLPSLSCREADREGSGSYHDLMHARFGKWGGRAVALAQVIQLTRAGGVGNWGCLGLGGSA